MNQLEQIKKINPHNRGQRYQKLRRQKFLQTCIHD